ncbi:hypothetical protein [Nocardioides aquiterrae]|uniref:HEAT repeat domain-containing protein n=1 Tax=Nocardioides aquiterrae TaxID=203799 RepID=A0ABP4F140_9ACTN
MAQALAETTDGETYEATSTSTLPPDQSGPVPADAALAWVRVLPDSPEELRAELAHPPGWIVGTFAGMVVASLGLTVLYGPHVRVELFDTLAASLLTMIGVVPGFASLLYVDRPALLLDRGMVAVRGWIRPALSGYGLIWLGALVTSLACASDAAAGAAWVCTALGLTLLATLLTPLVFVALVRRLGPRASTETVVAIAVGARASGEHDGRSQRGTLTKNLRDVAIREFEAGHRPSCEERLWGLATIAVLSDDAGVRRQAVDELAYVVEHEFLHDRDMALVGLIHLDRVAVREPSLRTEIAVLLVDILAGAIEREGVSGKVRKRAAWQLAALMGTDGDVHALHRLVEVALESAPSRTEQYLVALGQLAARATPEATEKAAQEALGHGIVDRIEPRASRVNHRLQLLELYYGRAAGVKKLAAIRHEAEALGAELFAEADALHPSAPAARERVRRAFENGTRQLYRELLSAVLKAEAHVPEDGVDPSGCLLAEYVLAAVRARDVAALDEIDSWLTKVSNDHYKRLAPALVVMLRPVRDWVLDQQGGHPSAEPDVATARVMELLDRWCWQAVLFGVRGGRRGLVMAAARTWNHAHVRGAVPDGADRRADLLADVSTELRDRPDGFDADVVAELRRAVVGAGPREGRLGLAAELYAGEDAVPPTPPEVALLLCVIDDAAGEDADPAGPVDGLRDVVRAWVDTTSRDDLYRACNEWAAGDRAQLHRLRRSLGQVAEDTTPGPLLLLGLKADDLDRFGFGDRPTPEAGEWLRGEAAVLLRRAIADADADELRHLRYAARTWFGPAVAALAAEPTWTAPLEILGDVTRAGWIPYRSITGSLRPSAVRSLPDEAKTVLVPALLEVGHPHEALRLLRGRRARPQVLAALAGIESDIRTGARPAAAASRAVREVASFGVRALVGAAGPAAVRALLMAAMAPLAVSADPETVAQADRAQAMLTEVDEIAAARREARRRPQR